MAQKKKPIVKTITAKPGKKATLAVKIGQHQNQGDLEAINKRLAQSQAELGTAYRQYTDLYDFAPVGYLTLARDGAILQANLAGANLLGVDHDTVTQLRLDTFVSSEYGPAFDVFFERLLSGEGKETCELAFEKKGNGLFWARLEATCFEGGDVCRAMLADITERRRMEQALQESENRFRSTLQDVPTIAVQGYAADGTTAYWNSASERLYGYTAEEAIGRNLLDLIIPPEMRPDVTEAIRQMAETGRPIPAAELSLMRKDGSRVPVFSSHAIVSVPGRERELFCLDVDLTERKHAEELLQESEKRFRNLVETTSDWIWEIDANGVYTYASPRIRDILGFEPSEVLGKRPDELMPPEEAQRVLGVLASIFATCTPFSNLENKNIHKDGRTIVLETSGVPVMDHDGVFCGYRGIDRDITERKRAEVELQHMREGLEATNAELQAALNRQQQLAHTDALTGINNRRHLYELAEHELEIATRYRQPFSVIMFDLDHFKDVNDNFGHTVGDQMLQSVTQVASAELRSADVIGRYGGEEFVIILPMTNAHHAYPLAERIRAKVAAIRVQTEKGDASVTLSIGIVEMFHSPKTDSIDDLVRRADEAMYTAKQAGRNRTEIGSQESDRP